MHRLYSEEGRKAHPPLLLLDLSVIAASLAHSPTFKPSNFQTCQHFSCTGRKKIILVSPVPATLARPLQLIEKTATLSPASAALASPVNHNSFACHSYRKHREVRVNLVSERASRSPAGLTDHESRNTHHGLRPLHTTHHSPLATISPTINTYKTDTKQTCLTLFRMNTYAKLKGGNSRVRLYHACGSHSFHATRVPDNTDLRSTVTTMLLGIGHASLKFSAGDTHVEQGEGLPSTVRSCVGLLPIWSGMIQLVSK